MAEKILVVDDEREIADLVALYLKNEGYETLVCYNGQEALEQIQAGPVDLAILDVMLPEISGFELCRRIRERYQYPVIMLTAKGDTLDRIQGLDLGADDYSVKPFDAKELLARIKAVLRRSSLPENEKCVTFEDLEISLDNYSVTLDGKQIEMPPKEIELLFFLASREGKVFTREQLLEQVWGFDFFGDSRTVDVHIRTLRQKLGTGGSMIETVRGVGYRIGGAQND